MSADKECKKTIAPTPIGPCPQCSFVGEEKFEFYCSHHRCGGLYCQSAGLRSWVLYQPITAMQFEIMRSAMKTIAVANGGEAGAAEDSRSGEEDRRVEPSAKTHD